MTYEELNTVLIEIEAVLNNRPLTFIYENDVEVPLTPSHLFCGRRLFDKEDQDAENPDKLDEDIKVTRKSMAGAKKKGESVVEHFWNRWRREYLVDLRENQKLHVQKQQPKINTGDVVLIEDDGVKRNKWRLGRIEKIVIGRDGVIRGAEVKTSKGIISRPLQKLYPLEVMGDDTSNSVNDDSVNESAVNESAVNGECVDTDAPSVPIASTTPETLPLIFPSTPPKCQTAPKSKNVSNSPESTMQPGDTTMIDAKSYGSSADARPKRSAGIAGEKRRRVERK